MPELIFEIWEDPNGGGVGFRQISEYNDEKRRVIDPGAVMIHTFTAKSLFHVFQANNDFHGYGVWLKPDMEDQVFTEEEVAEQQAYLLRRPPQ